MLTDYWKTIRSFTLAIALGCGSAMAQEKLEPAGMAAYAETARDIYIAALLLPAGTSLDNVYLAPGPKAMEYRISTRRLSTRSFAGTLLIQGEMGSAGRPPETAAKALGDVKARMKGALAKGDSFVIALSADEITSFYLNGTELLSVENGDVFDFFFAGWVGETSSALLRGELLAGKLDPAVQNRYTALAPSEDRQAEIASWIGPVPAPEDQQLAAVAEPRVQKPENNPAGKDKVQPADNTNNGTPAVVAATVTADVAAAVVETQATATPEEAAEQNAPPTVMASVEAPEPVATPAPASRATAAAEKATAAKATAAPDKRNVDRTAPLVAKSAPELEVQVEEKPENSYVQLAAMGTPSGLLEPEDDKQYQLRLSQYIGEVMSSVFGNVDYPRRAVKKNREGKVQLLARLDAAGELLEVTLDDSSGYTMLDEAAEKAVRRAAPFPELPPEAREEFVAEDGESYLVMIPVTFRLQN